MAPWLGLAWVHATTEGQRAHDWNGLTAATRTVQVVVAVCAPSLHCRRACTAPYEQSVGPVQQSGVTQLPGDAAGPYSTNCPYSLW